MQFLLMVCWDAENMDATPEPGPDEAAEEDSFPWLDDLRARWIWVTGDRLAPPRRARSVRVRNGKPIVSDGPFAETKEAVGGFYVVDCASREEAIKLAGAVPQSPGVAVEVLPIVDV